MALNPKLLLFSALLLFVGTVVVNANSDDDFDDEATIEVSFYCIFVLSSHLYV